MNKFEKVSFEQYLSDNKDSINDGIDKDVIKFEYDSIKLPRRATKYSAGYDFFAPFAFTLSPGDTLKIPTGIRVRLDDDKFLAIYPRSGLGFKYKLRLNNVVGIVDADYFFANNEGHIFIKLSNEGDKELAINKGEAFAQGIITQYFLTVDDDTDSERHGGIGSTSGKV